jgi:hypothetical protein
MSKFWQTAVENPRTTASGALSFLAITSGTLIPFVPGNSKYAAAGLAITFALSKAYNSALMKDPGKQLAVVPGEGVQMVDSHEVPNDPKAKVVKN